jgi:glycosyltransferase 2 family protein
MYKNPNHKWNLSTTLKYFFRLLISCLILYYVLYAIDFPRVRQIILYADFYLLSAAFVSTYLFPLCNALLLQIILKAYQVKADIFWLFRVSLITNFYSLFLPGAASGVVKWYKLSQKSKKTEAFNSIALVRLLDIAIACNCAALCYIFLGSIRIKGLGGTLAIAAILSSLALWCGFSKRILNYAHQFLKKNFFRYFPKPIGNISDKLFESLRILSTLPPLRVFLLIAISFFRLIVQVVRFYVVALAFNISVGYFDLFWILCSVQALSVLPISINGLGIREGIMVYALGQKGVSAEMAVSLSLGSFVLRSIMCLTGGILEMMPYDVSPQINNGSTFRR